MSKPESRSNELASSPLDNLTASGAASTPLIGVTTTESQPALPSQLRVRRGLLSVALLLVLGFPLTYWQVQPLSNRKPDHLGFDLRASLPIPRFNSNSAEAAPQAAPRPNADKRTTESLLELAALTSPIVIVPMPGIEPEPAFSEPPNVLTTVVYRDPGTLVCSCFRDLHQGVTPMLRNWNVVQMSALAAALTLSSPVVAQSTEEGKSLKNSIDALQKQLDLMHTDLAAKAAGTNADLLAIKNNLKTISDASDENKLQLAAMKATIKALEDQVGSLKSEVDKLQGRDKSAYMPDKGGMDDIKARLNEIEAALRKMAETRVSGASPTDLGRIQLVNMYPEDMLFVVNGTTHRVAPYTSKSLENQPVGTFLYEVISGTYGLRASNRPVLEAGKTYTITVR